MVNTLRKNLVLDIIQISHAHKKTEENTEADQIKVTETVIAFLTSHNHVVPSTVEKDATYLKIRRKIVQRNKPDRVKLSLDINTGRIEKN